MISLKHLLKKGNDTLLVMMGEDHLSFETDMSVLFVYEFDWNTYLSPWPAARIFKTGTDFEGKADEMIQKLLDLNLIQNYKHCYIAGYSLAGLFALYSCTKVNLFEGCICCSASLWYPDFYSYLQSHPVYAKRIYFSLGNKEKRSRNPVLAEIGNISEKTFQLMKQNHECVFEWNEGNHFSFVDERMRKGITWMNESEN